jgi:hypothetical protein
MDMQVSRVGSVCSVDTSVDTSWDGYEVRSVQYTLDLKTGSRSEFKHCAKRVQNEPLTYLILRRRSTYQ